MTELLTSAQMRAIETAAIESGAVTGLELMERAGRGVVDAIFAEWPELARAASGEGGAAPVAEATPPGYLEQDDGNALHAVVLCGPGNNGGDGFVVARLLHESGWDVDVFFYGDADKLPSDARVNYERWGEMGAVEPLFDFDAWRHNYDLAIDALFGTGLTRPINETTCLSIYEFNSIYRSVAIDMASGMCADSGRVMRRIADPKAVTHLRASLCVTFHARKLGHVLDEGPEEIEKLVVCDIGINKRDGLRTLGALPPKDGSAKIDRTIVVRMPEWDIFTAAFLAGTSILDKERGHKYTHGHALILSGGVGKGGAARLAARGALRVGAGAVTVGVPPAALVENTMQLNAIMLAKVGDVDALTSVLSDTRINALCAGPGFGVSAREKALLGAVLAAERPTVLDADALTMLADEPALFLQLHEACVLTPHAGEFSRLFPDIAEKLAAPAIKGPAYSKVDATRDAAKRAGCAVLFKGPDTVIAAPDGQCSINASVYERSAPWLATAGSGDVLAGFITGLLARGFEPMQAAETGAWLHTECALSFGPGLIAEDLPEVLPEVFAALFKRDA